MSACDALVFNNVNPQKFDCISKAVTAKVGIPVSGFTGTQSKDGFTVTWNYNAGGRTLTIQCLDSPLSAPCATINSKIRDIASGCGVT